MEQAATPTTNGALLDLSTLVERPWLTIDGKRYDMRVPSDFGLIHIAQFLREKEEIDDLMATQADQPATDERTVGRVVDLLTSACERIVVAPPEVLARLTDFQKLAVVDAFTRTVGVTEPTTPNRQARRTRRPTGAKSSATSAKRTVPTSG